MGRGGAPALLDAVLDVAGGFVVGGGGGRTRLLGALPGHALQHAQPGNRTSSTRLSCLGLKEAPLVGHHPQRGHDPLCDADGAPRLPQGS